MSIEGQQEARMSEDIDLSGVGKPGKPLTIDMLRQAFGEEGVTLLRETFPQFFAPPEDTRAAAEGE